VHITAIVLCNSPVCSGVIAAIIFFIVRTRDARYNAYSRVFLYFFPVLCVLLTV
jgi:hypothetical protein